MMVDGQRLQELSRSDPQGQGPWQGQKLTCPPSANVRAAMAAPAPRDAKRARPAGLEARVSTMELPGLGYIRSVLALKGGARLLGTVSALYLHVDGRLALLAGHPSKRGFKDGRGVEAPVHMQV